MMTVNYVVPPGDFIAEWMETEGIDTAELARKLAVSREHARELLTGTAPVSPPLAHRLERVSGVPARIWLQYENGYRSALRKTQDRHRG